MLLGDTLRSMVQYRLRWDQIFEQMYFIGIRSQVVVLTTGAFTGAVFAAQVWFQFKRFGMESAIGPTVSIAMCRELGPVRCGRSRATAASRSRRRGRRSLAQ